MCLIRVKRVRKLRSKGNLGAVGTRRAHTMGLEIRNKVAISFSSSFADMCAAATSIDERARSSAQKGIPKNIFFLPSSFEIIRTLSQSMMNFNSTNHFKFHLISHIVGPSIDGLLFLWQGEEEKNWQIRIAFT